MPRNLPEPHILNASSNPFKLIRNLVGLLEEHQLEKLKLAIYADVKQLYELGTDHFNFAQSLDVKFWRQKTSRFYYGAYNVRRAVALAHEGKFSTDLSDHTDMDRIPSTLMDASMYKQKLKDLREDRNLADYSHAATVVDLLIPSQEAERLVEAFLEHARLFLTNQGVEL